MYRKHSRAEIARCRAAYAKDVVWALALIAAVAYATTVEFEMPESKYDGSQTRGVVHAIFASFVLALVIYDFAALPTCDPKSTNRPKFDVADAKWFVVAGIGDPTLHGA